MKSNIWMPLYVGDYLSHTVDLTRAQHGAYLLSLMKYWTKGESLSDEELRAVCGRDFDRVSQFFVWDANRWHHGRVDRELVKAHELTTKRHAKAMAMVAARKSRQADNDGFI